MIQFFIQPGLPDGVLSFVVTDGTDTAVIMSAEAVEHVPAKVCESVNALLVEHGDDPAAAVRLAI